jgi:hypothetical protein
MAFIQKGNSFSKFEKEIQFIVKNTFVDELLTLSKNEYASVSVRATVRQFLTGINISGEDSGNQYLAAKIEKYLNEPMVIAPSKTLAPPDGSPIGLGEKEFNFGTDECTNFH